MLEVIKPIKKETILVYTVGILLLIISGIYFGLIGYPIVQTATGTLDQIVPPIYMLPVFLLYGFLIGELFWTIIKERHFKASMLLLIELTLIGIFAFIRYIFIIPCSGHAIILSFYLLYQLISNKYPYPVRILIGILVLVITIVYKIVLWNDPITFLLGSILGIVIWILGFYSEKTFMKGNDIQNK